MPLIETKSTKVYVMPVGALQANCYLLACGETRKGAVIDPGGDAEKIEAAIERERIEPEYIVNTHLHPDHSAANAALKRRYGVPLLMHRQEAAVREQASLLRSMLGFIFEESPPPDRLIEDGEEIRVGLLAAEVIHTPGHTPGGICLYLAEPGGDAPILFSGDTVFEGSVGRSDLPGGSHEVLMDSIAKRIAALPDETRILPGHGADTTVGREKRYNPFFQSAGGR